jgi:hypothetical protein
MVDSVIGPTISDRHQQIVQPGSNIPGHAFRNGAAHR